MNSVTALYKEQKGFLLNLRLLYQFLLTQKMQFNLKLNHAL